MSSAVIVEGGDSPSKPQKQRAVLLRTVIQSIGRIISGEADARKLITREFDVQTVAVKRREDRRVLREESSGRSYAPALQLVTEAALDCADDEAAVNGKPPTSKAPPCLAFVAQELQVARERAAELKLLEQELDDEDYMKPLNPRRVARSKIVSQEHDERLDIMHDEFVAHFQAFETFQVTTLEATRASRTRCAGERGLLLRQARLGALQLLAERHVWLERLAVPYRLESQHVSKVSRQRRNIEHNEAEARSAIEGCYAVDTLSIKRLCRESHRELRDAQTEFALLARARAEAARQAAIAKEQQKVEAEARRSLSSDEGAQRRLLQKMESGDWHDLMQLFGSGVEFLADVEARKK